MIGESYLNLKEYSIIFIAQAILLVPVVVLGMRCSPKQQAMDSGTVQKVECTTESNTGQQATQHT